MFARMRHFLTVVVQLRRTTAVIRIGLPEDPGAIRWIRPRDGNIVTFQTVVRLLLLLEHLRVFIIFGFIAEILLGPV